MRALAFSNPRAADPPVALMGMITTGQSLGEGFASLVPAIPPGLPAAGPPLENLMLVDSLGTTSGYVVTAPQATTLSLQPLAGPQRTVNGGASVPYAQNIGGIAPDVPMANQLATLMIRYGFTRWPVFATNAAIGGAPSTAIEKGGTLNSYAACIFETQAAAPGAGNGGLAARKGFPTFAVGFTVLRHGETDSINYANGLVTSPSVYQSFAATLQSDLETDTRAAAPLTIPWLPHVPMVLSECNSSPGNFQGVNIVTQAMTNLYQAFPELFAMACPTNQFPQNGLYHLADYRAFGEVQALCIARYLIEHYEAQGRPAFVAAPRPVDPNAWAPLHVTGVARSGLTITASIHVPPGIPTLGISRGVLFFDTVTVAAFHQAGSPFAMWSGGNGFEYWDSRVNVTGCTNASPIAMTFDGPHNRANGDLWAQEGITGNQAANGVFPVTVTGPDSLTLNGSTGSGAWTGGGEGFAPIAITASSIVGDSVEFTVARAPGPGASVAYGEHSDQPFSAFGTTPMRGGNIRDTSNYSGTSQQPPPALYCNWLCRFVGPIT